MNTNNPPGLTHKYLSVALQYVLVLKYCKTAILQWWYVVILQYCNTAILNTHIILQTHKCRSAAWPAFISDGESARESVAIRISCRKDVNYFGDESNLKKLVVSVEIFGKYFVNICKFQIPFSRCCWPQWKSYFELFFFSSG